MQTSMKICNCEFLHVPTTNASKCQSNAKYFSCSMSIFDASQRITSSKMLQKHYIINNKF